VKPLSRSEFYNNLKRNKFVIVPGEDIIEQASELSLPYFSIIEIPIKKYLLVKKQELKKKLNRTHSKYKS
jgi:hypothetical protein